MSSSLRTPVCELLGIDVPIMCAPFGPWDEVELAAAVCNAGALGSLGTAVRPLDELREQWARLRELTQRPFAINHTLRPFDEEAFAATLEAKPAAISFHIGVPPDLIERAHEAGILWLQQVSDLEQAREALAAGADVLIAQGGEAGGNGGWIGSMALVPQVVDLAGSLPVLAAGGIADGRGLAAALALGAQGVNLGTRFLASTEMAVSDAWKQRIVEAGSLDAVKVTGSEAIMPPYSRPGIVMEPRALRTPLVDALAADPDSVDVEATRRAFVEALRQGGGDELLPFAGQSVGLIHAVLPAEEIVRRIVAEADAALAAAARLRRT
jgi:nitronate monooxygenase/enoyl-[acyl-carrier protein] reductase II